MKTNKLSILRFSALGFGFAFVEKTLCHFTINLLTFAWADDGGHQVIGIHGMRETQLFKAERKAARAILIAVGILKALSPWGYLIWCTIVLHFQRDNYRFKLFALYA
ncbi:MAG: hypothetical protein ACFKPT_04370 [Gloeotrichia echinulata GP01]